METELTIKIDENILENVEKYTQENKITISELIEKFFKSVTADKSEANKSFEITPFVQSLKTGVKIPENFDEKELYSKYLEEKHK